MTELRMVNNDFAESLNHDGMIVMRGWNNAVRRALVDGAREDIIKKMTPGDVERRFTTIQSAEAWYQNETKRPVVYSLAEQAIGGVIWFSYQREIVSDADVTFAIRMYSSLRGRRLAGRFLDAAHEDFIETTGYEGKIWLMTDKQHNEDAINLYTSHGYWPVNDTAHTLTMLREQRPKGVHLTPEKEAEYTTQYNASHDLNNL